MTTASVKKILVPVDFGDLTKPSVEYAQEMAKVFGASLVIVHVIHVPPLADAGAWLEPAVPPAAETDLLFKVRESSEKTLSEIANALTEKGLSVETRALVGIPYSEIIKAAEDTGADLIIMGSQGRTGLSHFLIGSVAERVVRRSRVNVLVVKPEAQGKAAD